MGVGKGSPCELTVVSPVQLLPSEAEGVIGHRTGMELTGENRLPIAGSPMIALNQDVAPQLQARPPLRRYVHGELLHPAGHAVDPCDRRNLKIRSLRLF